MKKQLRFLYRYFIASHRWRRWINRQNMIIALISVVFLTVLSWTAPLSVVEGQGPSDAHLAGLAVSLEQLQETPAPTEPAAGKPTGTPMPAEFIANADQTIGITLAGALLVLIVIIGVLRFQPVKEQHK